MSGIKYIFFIVLFILCSICIGNCEEKSQQNTEDNWEQDLSDSFKIEGSDQGIQKVNLKCGSESMHIQLETEKEFTGVMYTRGSFHKQTEPCFTKPKTERGSKSLEMQFTFDQCQTIQDGDIYSNIVVIQNDPELVTPGDSAFSLECDFRKPRNLQVEAEMQTRERIAIGSRITLTSPDPSSISDNLDTNDTVYSESNECSYVPKKQKSIRKAFGTVEEVPFGGDGDEEIVKDEL